MRRLRRTDRRILSSTETACLRSDSRLGVSWQSIASANGIYSPYTDLPGAGAELSREDHPEAASITLCSTEIHCRGLRRRMGTSYQYLAQVNGISNPNLIYTGQAIRVQ